MRDASIAIVGIGCRFPGAEEKRAFWKLLTEGRDAISAIPTNRFGASDVFDARPGTPGKLYAKWGGFLPQGLDEFDASYFGLSAIEAESMDPQARILLEVAVEALEDAGLPAHLPRRSNTGVFVGALNDDYENLLSRDPEAFNVYAWANSQIGSIAGRISYCLDLHGPSFVVDTACSSGLSAVHLACQSLRAGECDVALAAGVNVLLMPEYSMGYSSAKMLAPDGRSKAFDASADGTVRSEGAGVLVLKPVAQALADGDSIYAVIKGSASRHDGHVGAPYMSPSVQGQVEVLKAAYGVAGVNPHHVHYVEAHGTGTVAGDPVEVSALAQVLCEGRDPKSPLRIGSVKTNIGHTESAAGVAGLIKLALAMKKNWLPKSLHFKTPNPRIPWASVPLMVQSEPGRWQADGRPLTAGVSSFGISKTNVHIVVQEAPPKPRPTETPAAFDRPVFVALSAGSPEALQTLVADSRDAVAEHLDSGEHTLEEVAASSCLRRTRHDHMVGFVVRSNDELKESMSAFVEGEQRPGIVTGRKAAGKRNVVFVFPGQGSQWVGMGRQLLAKDRVFREAIAACDKIIQAQEGWSVIAELNAPEDKSRLTEIQIIQPTLFAIEVALATWWREMGVVPTAVVGHSMGEVAAAHIAGALSLDDACRVICTRSRLMRSIRSNGSMATLQMSAEEVKVLLRGKEDRVGLAAINGPRLTVISGDTATVEEIVKEVQSRDIFCRLVKVDVASHSPHVDPLKDDLLAAFKDLKPQHATIPFFSTVTPALGRRSSDKLLFDANYWWQNLRTPVLFSDTIRLLLRNEHDVFLEISPHPILKSPMEQTVTGANATALVVSSLRRQVDEDSALLESTAQLFAAGADIHWERWFGRPSKFARLPNPLWHRERFWMPRPASEKKSQLQPRAQRSAFLLNRLELAEEPGKFVWQVDLNRATFPYLEDHRVQDTVVVPGMAIIETVLQATSSALGEGPKRLQNIEFKKAIFLSDHSSTDLQLVMGARRESDGQSPFQLLGRPKGSTDAWVQHATGWVSASAPADHPKTNLGQIRARCQSEINAGEFYVTLADVGNQYGKRFRLVESLRCGTGEVLAEVNAGADVSAEEAGYHFHPAFLDACLQPIIAAFGSGRAFMPIKIDRLDVFRRPTERLYTHVTRKTDSRGDVLVATADGEAVCSFEGVSLFYFETERPRAIEAKNVSDWLYEVSWEPSKRAADLLPTERGARVHSTGPFLVVSDRGEVGSRVANRLGQKGPTLLLLPEWRDAEPAMSRIDEKTFRVRPGDREAIVSAITQWADGKASPFAGVVHLGSLDAAAPERLNLDGLRAAARCGVMSAVASIQALEALQLAQLKKLLLVTKGAQSVEAGEPVAIAQAPIWGLGRTLLQENPAVPTQLLDLPSQSADLQAELICRELLEGDGEQQVSYRTNLRFAARLSRAARAQTSKTAPSVQNDAAYLVTGGLGGLGLLVANWLAANGARHLILLGRTPLPHRDTWPTLAATHPHYERVATVRSLEKLGVSVEVAALDVGNQHELEAFLQTRAAAHRPPIRGVVHAAGTVHSRLVTELKNDEIAEIFKSKIEGSWNLHRLLGDHLDFFLLFSSGSSVLSSPRLGAYAAANAFLDALAAFRKAQSLPATSVNWGAWSKVGMAARSLADGWGASTLKGVRAIEADQGLSLAGRLISLAPPQTAVLPIDWAVWLDLYPSFTNSTFLSKIVRAESAVAQPTNGATILERIVAGTEADRPGLIEAHLVTQISELLRLKSKKLDPQVALVRFGLDSLMASELQVRLRNQLKVNVPAVKLLDGATIVQLVKLVGSQLGSAAAAAAPAQPEPQAALNLDELSDERVAALLEQMVDQSKP